MSASLPVGIVENVTKPNTCTLKENTGLVMKPLFTFMARAHILNALQHNWYNKVILTNYIVNGWMFKWLYIYI